MTPTQNFRPADNLGGRQLRWRQPETGFSVTLARRLVRKWSATIGLATVSRLLACPFCREMFDGAETEQCPDCDIPLQPLHQLPPSLAAVEEEALGWEQNPPEDQLRPWHDLGRGRGLLLGIALGSLLAFWFAPWVDISSPHAELRSGYSLARGPLGWLWGGAIAWFVSLALVASRRSVNQMRGVRAILMLFSAMTLTEVVMLVALSPSGSRQVHFAYEWSWGLYLSLALSIAGILGSARFGGPLRSAQPAAPAATSEPADAPTLH